MTKFGHRDIAVLALTLFYAFVILYLEPLIKYQWMSLTVFLACLFILVIDPLPYAVTEWVKTRYRYVVASTRHRLYGPDTSTSAFLLLPPEIRLRIWEELTPPRAHTRMASIVYSTGTMNYFDGIGDAARYVFGLKRRSQISVYPTIPVALLRTCRQIYEEGCHYFYGTRTFYFYSPRTLLQFLNALSLPQQGHIQHLEFLTDSRWCIKPVDHRDRDWHRHMYFCASQVPSVLEKLQNLRTLDIGIQFPIIAENVGYHARFMYQLLRHVKASETVTVNMDLRISNRGYRKIRWGWGSQDQKKFAITAWRILRDPTVHVKSVVARPGGFMRLKYVLVAQVPV